MFAFEAGVVGAMEVSFRYGGSGNILGIFNCRHFRLRLVFCSFLFDRTTYFSGDSPLQSFPLDRCPLSSFSSLAMVGPIFHFLGIR